MTTTKKVLLLTLGVLVAMLLLILIWATSFGYFPGLADTFGLGAAKDLGVEYTDEDYQTATDKVDEAVATQNVRQTFTEAEVTALLNTCTVAVCILEDAQLTTDSDGRLEISGEVEREAMLALVPSLNSIAQYLPAQPPVYLEARITGADDDFTVTVEAAKVGGLNLPEDKLGSLSLGLTQMWADYLAELPGTQVHELTVTEQGIYVDADLTQFELDSADSL